MKNKYSKCKTFKQLKNKRIKAYQDEKFALIQSLEDDGQWQEAEIQARIFYSKRQKILEVT